MDRTTRLMIWNQLEIMKLLRPEQSDELSTEQEVIANGYTSLYENLLQHISPEEAGSKMQEEVWATLDMFRALDTAKRSGWIPSDADDAVFQGFDGNNDEHYHFARHLLDQAGAYDESSPNKNSHSQYTIEKYRRMLKVWEASPNKFAITDTEAEAIIGA